MTAQVDPEPGRRIITKGHSSGTGADFDQWVADARAVDLATTAARYGATLKRAGRELIGACPACGGTDRFSVNEAKGVFHCRQAGAGGDVIAMVQYLGGGSFLAACEELTGRPPPGRDAAETPAERQAREERQGKRVAALQAEAERRAEAEEHFREAERRRAYEIWSEGVPIAGTPAAAYMAARGIQALDGVGLRFAECSYWTWSSARGAFERAGRYPTMLAAITEPTSGGFLAVHMTYLDPSAPRKAMIVHPETGEPQPAKKIRGSKRGGVIWLAGADVSHRLVLAEGIETALSDREMRLRYGKPLDGIAWAAGIDLQNIGGPARATVPHPDGLKRADRAGRMRLIKIASSDPDPNRPGLEIPYQFTEITILQDGDSEPRETQFAMTRAAMRWRTPGRRIGICAAPTGQDWNDVLRAKLKAGCTGMQNFSAEIAAVDNASNGSPDMTRAVHVARDKGGEENQEVSSTYSVETINRIYSLVWIGNKMLVQHYDQSAEAGQRLKYMTPEAFKIWLGHTSTTILVNNRERQVTYAERWLKDPRRLQYKGIVFKPHPKFNPANDNQYYNLWRGFSEEPEYKKNGYKIFRDHLLNNICSGREDWYQYIFAWFAHMVQRPWERIGIALVFRGKMGTGKTKIGNVFGSLIDEHYFPVDDARYVTGQFNQHMEAALLLQIEEAVWAGDKAAEGRLKGMITSTVQMIERKGVDPFRLPNLMRLMFTSNERWVVPAGLEERRFAVFDVGDNVKEDHGYFAEMDAELNDGGRAALLYDLLNFDLSTVNLRRAPRTAALLEQKLRSLSPVIGWWYERLQEGSPTRHHSGWTDQVTLDDLYNDFLHYPKPKWQVVSRDQMSRTLLQFDPGIARYRMSRIVDEDGRQKPDRPRGYRLPTLADSRAAFEAAVQQAVDWDDDQDIAERDPDLIT